LGARARTGLERLISLHGVPMQITGVGSLFRLHLKASRPRTYREAWPTQTETVMLARLSRALLDQGVVVPAATSSSCSTVMTETDVDLFLEAFESALTKEKEALMRLWP